MYLVKPYRTIDGQSFALHTLDPKRRMSFLSVSRKNPTYCTGRATGLSNDHRPLTPIVQQLA